MEAWTSTAQLKAAPDTESVAGVEACTRKRKWRVGLDCSVINPFLTVESNKETLINMIPKADSVEYSSFSARRV